MKQQYKIQEKHYKYKNTYNHTCKNMKNQKILNDRITQQIHEKQ